MELSGPECVMIIILYVFLWAVPGFTIFPLIKQGWNKLIIVFLGILPFLNLSWYWDFIYPSSPICYKALNVYM